MCENTWNVLLRGPIAAARLSVFNFVERLRERCVRRYRLKTRSTLVLMLIDCCEHYDSSVDVDCFRASFPNPRRQRNARNFRGAALLHVADHAIPKLHACPQRTRKACYSL